MTSMFMKNKLPNVWWMSSGIRENLCITITVISSIRAYQTGLRIIETDRIVGTWKVEDVEATTGQ